ncbi:MAG: hypothetical protein Q7R40_12460 [Phaeospirillum sp.]|nr:hypothetical protein [Phaeospirillum sp.]
MTRRDGMGPYATLAVITLNFVIAAVIVNLLALAALHALDWAKLRVGGLVADNPWADRQRVYPGWDKTDIQALLKERADWPPYAYEPLGQFKEHPGKGRFYTITEAGWRATGAELPWPPAPDRINVFVFGGSTVFGWGVSDGDTVPAALQRLLDPSAAKVAVYNFGQSYYFSTHELLLFQRLAMQGIRPDVAVFVDGLNEFFHHETFLFMSDHIATVMENQAVTVGTAFRRLAVGLPLVRLAEKVSARFAAKPVEQQAEASIQQLMQGGSGAKAEAVLDRYLANKALIERLAETWKVRPLFVWQPVPTYRYDLAHHPFKRDGMAIHAESGNGYEAAKTRHTAGAFGDGFVWCADIQHARQEPLYVDAVHYTAAFSKDLAGCIIDSGLDAVLKSNGRKP